jgi:hypothetical protein
MSTLANVFAGLAFAALVAVSLRPATRDSLPDFDKAYYTAGRKALSAPEELYAAATVDFVNVPLLALPFVPVSALPERTARVVFGIVGMAALGLAAVWFFRSARLDPWGRAVAMLLLVLNGPLHYSVALGNLSHVLLPVLLAAFTAGRAGREPRAGALAGLAAVVKLPLFVLGLGFVLRRRWRAFAAFAGCAAALLALSLLLFGLELHRTWFERCVRPFAAGPLTAYNVQSLDGFLARLLTDGGRQDFSPTPVGGAFHAARAAALALLFGAVIGVCRKGGAGPALALLDLTIALVLALLVSPISWAHYYVFLVLPLWFALAGWIPTPAGVGRLLGLCGVLLAWLPVLATPGRAGAALFWLYRGTAHSPHFLGGVLLLAALLSARRQATRLPRR